MLDAVPFTRGAEGVLTLAVAGATPPVAGGATMTATQPGVSGRRGCGYSDGSGAGEV